MSHIEVIHAGENLSPQLGGTGYLPPSSPSSVEDLIADLDKARAQSDIGLAVWKVLRTSPRQPRQLTLPNGRRLKCKIAGGTRGGVYYWWFAFVSVADGLKALAKPATTNRVG